MGKIITYQENQFSQIKLDSGERIMLSCSQAGIDIFKMRFFGVVPARKIASWKPDQLPEFIESFGGAPFDQTPFNFTVEKLSSFKNIADLKNYLNRKDKVTE